MLSNSEIRRIQRRLEENLSKTTRKQLKKTLTEHHYATKYPPFAPLTHQHRFLNRCTSTNDLEDLIRHAETSRIILMDTESKIVHYQPNQPALIQLQILPVDEIPIVVIVEVHHLPPNGSETFELMRRFFGIILSSNKEIYSWGSIGELAQFAQFGLFNLEQIDQPDDTDLQKLFKPYWWTMHPHTPARNCRCEDCLKKAPTESWSLQQAVAEQRREWLDKRHSCSEFDAGLDPRLNTLDAEQRKRQKQLVEYASNDCLSMERLLINMQENFPPNGGTDQSVDRIETDIEMDDTPPTVTFTITLPVEPPPPLPSQTRQKFSLVNSPTTHRHRPMEDDRSTSSHVEATRTKADRHEHGQSDRRRICLYSSKADRKNECPQEHHYVIDNRGDNHRVEHLQRNTAEPSADNRWRHRTTRQEEEINTTPDSDPDSYIGFEPRRTTNTTDNNTITTEDKNEPSETTGRNENNGSRSTTSEPSRTKNTDPLHPVEEQKKRINRKATVKQRRRNYKYEIIRRGIDPRFSIKAIKEILRGQDVSFSALNISKSKVTGRTSLYIGVKQRANLRDYEVRTRNLFSTEHYHEFRVRHQPRESM